MLSNNMWGTTYVKWLFLLKKPETTLESVFGFLHLICFLFSHFFSLLGNYKTTVLKKQRICFFKEEWEFPILSGLELRVNTMLWLLTFLDQV